MINKLKKRFTLLATVSMFILMTVLVLIMNIVNFTSVISESDSVLDVLAQPNAPFSGFDGKSSPPNIVDRPVKDFIPRGMSPEVPYESRFFMAIVSNSGEIKESDLTRIVSVDEESAKEYIKTAVDSKKERGFIGQFRYSKTSDDRITRILFLDCGRKLDAFRTFLWTSIGVGLFGCIIVFITFLFVSGRIVRPIGESYEKQKRFISDAGHEIKTPLTIINANLDLLEYDEKKEELSEIRQQTKRLTDLTNNLVYLSKMEETEHREPKAEIILSEIVAETVNSFNILASSKNIELVSDIVPDISVSASPEAIRQLISVLLDNAVKYSPECRKVKICLSVCKKNAALSVLNETEEKISNDDLLHVFDRFYRMDASRNSETGGHGIGLSIAKAVADSCGGNISAGTQTGNDFCVMVSLPI